MAFGAGADCSVIVGLADGMALLAARCDGWMTFRHREWIGPALDASGLVSFAERNLFRRQAIFSMYRGPAGSGVAAPQEFLINALMARAAIAGCEVLADLKAVMIHLLLAGSRLVTLEAVDSLVRVFRHLVLVDH